MASLRAHHQPHCAIVVERTHEKAARGETGRVSNKTTYDDAAPGKGCTCSPGYWLVHGGGKNPENVGKDRKAAAKRLTAVKGQLASGEYIVVQNIGFDEWADRWLAGFTGKESSRRAYSYTLDFAKATFGRSKVRNIRATDIRRLLDHIREANKPRDVAPATLAKHLRQLGACLEAAIAEGYATENAVRKLHKTARPRVAKSRPAYFTDAELARLWPELAERPVYLNVFKLAAATGMRQGELFALRWSDVDLLNREIHVRQAYAHGIGLDTVKSNEPRTVDLTPQAATLLEEWLVESGGEGLVFQNETGDYLDAAYVTRRVLYPALERAGIPRLGERGRLRTFHSFRHSFARLALEHGAEITWVQKQLGHSSITLTVDTYGSWARSAEKAQAEKLAGAFPL